jgi:hypothetical protein
VLWSDLIGALAGGALFYPAAKDQVLRYKAAKERGHLRMRRFRQIVATAWETKRSEYDGADTFFLGAGGFGLLVSFGLKLFGV